MTNHRRHRRIFFLVLVLSFAVNWPQKSSFANDSMKLVEFAKDLAYRYAPQVENTVGNERSDEVIILSALRGYSFCLSPHCLTNGEGKANGNSKNWLDSVQAGFRSIYYQQPKGGNSPIRLIVTGWVSSAIVPEFAYGFVPSNNDSLKLAWLDVVKEHQLTATFNGDSTSIRTLVLNGHILLPRDVFSERSTFPEGTSSIPGVGEKYFNEALRHINMVDRPELNHDSFTSCHHLFGTAKMLIDDLAGAHPWQLKPCSRWYRPRPR